MTQDKEPRRFSHVDDVMAILNQISIFAGLNDCQLYAIFQELEEVSYSQDEFIFEQGTEPSHIYIILKGAVKLTVGQDSTSLELIEFRPGDCFGETSVIGIVPHEASAVAACDVELLVFIPQGLVVFLEDRPGTLQHPDPEHRPRILSPSIPKPTRSCCTMSCKRASNLTPSSRPCVVYGWDDFFSRFSSWSMPS